jgi:hypothetical protein
MGRRRNVGVSRVETAGKDFEEPGKPFLLPSERFQVDKERIRLLTSS